MGIVVQDSAPVRREGSVYALGFMDAKGLEAEIVDTLLDALEKDPVARVRAQAAESLANRLRFTRIKGGSRAKRALIKHLTDTSADVRFWCAYAVGELRLNAAVSSLRHLTRDRASVSGWWSVGTEARDALKVIAGGDGPGAAGHTRRRSSSRIADAGRSRPASADSQSRRVELEVATVREFTRQNHDRVFRCQPRSQKQRQAAKGS